MFAVIRAVHAGASTFGASLSLRTGTATLSSLTVFFRWRSARGFLGHYAGEECAPG
ncbi:MAG: hypothetical protein ACYTDX_08305 [Planctomycetota bacterium]|jgi:hypothetical protein